MKILKRIVLSVAIALTSLCYQKAQAQIVAAEVIKLTVKRVIKAIDLKVQRMQNSTIWLQNAQKVLENELSKLKLAEISGWSGEQQKLFGGYYDELWKIKSLISYYQRIKDLTSKQVALVAEYNRAWNLLKNDQHFNAEELSEMKRVYNGILAASVQNLDQILMVINPGKTQMSDEQRLELINNAGNILEVNYNDLHRYNTQNLILSMQRSRNTGDVKTTQMLYGLN